jgi:hypothetical protein
MVILALPAEYLLPGHLEGLQTLEIKLKRNLRRPISIQGSDRCPTDTELTPDRKNNVVPAARHLDRVAFRLRSMKNDFKCGCAFQDSIASEQTDEDTDQSYLTDSCRHKVFIHFPWRRATRISQHGAYNDTALIISSDQGENHGELGVWGDHQTADHITSRVPLVVRWAGLTDNRPGEVYSGFQYNIDLSATLVDLAGGTIPKAWDGRTFAETIRSGEENGRAFLVVIQGSWACQRAVRWDDWILIRTCHTGFKDFPSILLFNIADDPHATRELSDEKPELVAEGLRRLESWITDNLRKSGREDPLMGVIAEGGPHHGITAEQHNLPERLRSTGRDHLADWLERNGGLPRD